MNIRSIRNIPLTSKSVKPLSKSRKRVAFDDRLEHGEKVEDRVKAYLESRYKLKVYPHGIQTLPPQHRKELKVRSDQTSKNIRYEPDLWIPIPNHRDSFLIDVKSTLPGTKTDNFSINLDEYNAQCRKQDSGSQILYVFDTIKSNEIFYAEWLQNLDKLIEWQNELKCLKHANGSGKEFGLISKYKLRHLDSIIRELLSNYSLRGVG